MKTKIGLKIPFKSHIWYGLMVVVHNQVWANVVVSTASVTSQACYMCSKARAVCFISLMQCLIFHCSVKVTLDT